MLRLLLLALIIYSLVRLLRRAARPASRRSEGSAAPGAAGEMVACARCGTFVLKAEAVEGGGRLYCSEGCRTS